MTASFYDNVIIRHFLAFYNSFIYNKYSKSNCFYPLSYEEENDMSVSLVSERLIDCRKKNGLSKVEAAKKVGVTQSGYVRYESGERKPTIQVVEAIAAAFGTSTDYLLGLSDDPSSDRITILQSENPILFEIAKDFNQLNLSQQKRVFSYFQNISHTN